MFTRRHLAPPTSHRSTRLIFTGIFSVLIVFFLWQFFSGNKVLIDHKNLLAVPWPTELEFAGEPVPLTDFYIREAWEKEFLVALSQDYQNILYLKRSAKFFPLIEAELRARDLPDDLKYLAVAESALKEFSTSSAGAAGIWQFIADTARRYGLRVDNEVDERRHFEKATRAALTYLTFLHNKFDNWTLATAGYNLGENGLARRIENQGVETYYDLYLNSETSQYLFRILAIKTIMEDPTTYGYELAESDYFAWPDYKLKSVNRVSDLTEFAHENDTTLRTLKELNRWIVGDSLPDGEWQVKVVK